MRQKRAQGSFLKQGVKERALKNKTLFSICLRGSNHKARILYLVETGRVELPSANIPRKASTGVVHVC